MVTNRVFKVLATNGTAMANIADTGPSEYLVIKEDGTVVSATTPLTKDDKVQIVVNDPSGVKIFSDFIRVGDITSYKTKTYVAKVEQVVTLTLATPVAGIEYSVSVIDKSEDEILQARQAKRTYSIVAATGENVTSLGDKFRNLINKDSASIVTASGTTTLVLTAKAQTPNVVAETQRQRVFEVFSSSIDNTVYPIAFPALSGTVVYTTAPNYGSGSGAQVRALELKSQGYRGITNRTKFPAPAPVYLAAVGSNYDVAIIEFDNRHDTNVVVEGEKRAPETLIVAAVTGASATLFGILAQVANPQPEDAG